MEEKNNIGEEVTFVITEDYQKTIEVIGVVV